MIGTSLGHYRILDKLGAGGMGEVYRARDTRLGRDVALKVLPEVFSKDADRMARFEREAQVLASLNHPNIAALYGLEESGGVRALVMELVEGPTVAQRIEAGPVPIEEALPIARQIAEALEYAHDRGIIHRDLKPANVKLTPEGAVKVLDFGLAKALDDDPGASDLRNSPTLSLAATRAGVILGTAAYMSPEQARGSGADRRADVWAFGAVLYEMLVGAQPFRGDTVSDVLASVLKFEPEWEKLPGGTPAGIRKLLERCLTKDRRQRLQAIGEARIAIERVGEGDRFDSMPARGPAAAQGGRPTGWVVVGLVTVAAGVGMWWMRAPAPVARPVVHLSAPVPQLAGNVGIALSPDGSRLAYSAGSPPRLHVRMLDQLEGKPIAGTEDGRDPFFSPEGQWLGFYQQGKWKKVQVVGGAAITLCDGSTSSNGVGATWGADGTIVFGALSQGLSRVSAAGGASQAVTKLDQKRGDRAHRWPQILPGGKAVLFAAGQAAFDDAKIVALSLQDGQERVLVEGGSVPRYVATGHIVYWRSGSLFAVPFDVKRLQVTGSAVPVLEGVQGAAGSGQAKYSVSEAGSLVYVPGSTQQEARNLVWVDRQGKAQPIPAPPNPYLDARLSPEGQRVAVTIGGERFGIWVWDLPRGTLTKLTFQGSSTAPVWTPDGKRVTFATVEGGKRTIGWTLADGSGQPETLAQVGGWPSSWSPDGKLLAFSGGEPAQTDIFLLPLPNGRGSEKARRFLQTPHLERDAMFSPDGRWIAYTSFESGPPQVYVRPAAGDAGGKWLISTGAGFSPRWASGGRELFYGATGGKIMVVAVEPGPAFRPGTPKELFTYASFVAAGSGGYDVSADGKRFLMIASGAGEQASAAPEIHFVLEWFEEVRRRVRAGG
jgi:serine/threonine-protein kinase